MVEIVALGYVSIICFPLPFSMLDSHSESEHASDFEAFSLATNDYLAGHSLVLWVELLWNSHHFLVSSFEFVVFSFSYGFGGLSWVVLSWILSFFPRFGSTVPLLHICRSKVSLLLFKLLLDLDDVSVHHSKWGDVSELHLVLDLSIWEATILEYQMFLRILDTQLRVKGMKNIGQLWHILVSSLL